MTAVTAVTFLKQKNAVGAGIVVMEVVPLLILALDVRLGLGGCCCSSPGPFLLVEVAYLVKALLHYKYRYVLCSSLHLLSPHCRNFFVPIPDVVFPCFLIIIVVFCFSLLFADLVAGRVLFKFASSCSCF